MNSVINSPARPGALWLRRAAVVALSALGVMAAGCGASSGPAAAGAAASGSSPGMQEARVSSTAPDAGSIVETYVRQYEPLPATAAEHPPECDWISYLRFRHVNGPTDPSAADAILVGMPGNLAGAGHLDIIARNVILNADEKGKHVEFWALDRRSNCVEDRSGMMAATAGNDYHIAFDYYFGGKAVNGHTFEGFKSSADLAWLADVGLGQTVRDYYAVITKGIPDPAVRAKKVFCGGHSHGGLITAAFAAWDFDGDPATTDDAGYNQCAGYFALETTVAIDPAGLGAFYPLTSVTTEQAYDATVEAIRSGALPRIETSASPLTPETMLVLTLAAQAGYQKPGTETDLMQLLPHTQNIDQANRLLFSRDAVAFVTGQPDARDIRMTNEALFGAFIDDNSMPLGFVAASVGTFKGGPVTEKNFPTPEVLAPALMSIGAGILLTANPLMIPAETKGPLYGWRHYDEMDAPDAEVQVDSLGRPFTSAANENTDIHQWARASFEAPADLVEWYFPMRLMTDTIAATAGLRGGDLANLRYNDGPTKHPTITILGGDSLGPTLGRNPQLGAAPNQLLVLPGYNHPDVTSAARVQNDGSREKSSQALTDFVLSIAAP